MKLIRGWESRYLPQLTGGLRLNKVSMYHDADELDGIGDHREGEFRLPVEHTVDLSASHAIWDQYLEAFANIQEDIETADREMIRKLYAEYDDPNMEIIHQGNGHYLVRAHIKHDITGEIGADTPYVLCMSREPTTKMQWDVLQASLPDRYDAWTITTDIQSLKFEIECGIKRWLGLNEIGQHRMGFCQQFISYDYDDAPTDDTTNAGHLIANRGRWLRKSRKYKEQNEYRLLWEIDSPQMPTMPDSIDIELTRTGLALFRPWDPPV